MTASWSQVGGGDGLIRVWRRPEAKPIVELKGHAGAIKSLAFEYSGGALVSAGSDGAVGVWKLAPVGASPSEPLFLRAGSAPINAVAFLDHGRQIVAGGDDGVVRTWHADDGKQRLEWRPHSAPILALAVSPDESLVLTGSADKSAAISRLAEGSVSKVFTEHAGPVSAAAFSPDGATFLTGGEEGSVKVRVTSSGQGVIAFAHKGDDEAALPVAVRAAAFLGDRSIISIGANPFAKLFAYEGAWSELARLKGHVFRVLAIDFSPQGGLLATGGGEPSRSGEVKLWTLPKVALVRTFDTLHSDTVFAVRFSPDGSKLATAAADKFARITNIGDGRLLRTFEGHTGHVLGIDWKPDGKQLVTAGSDNVIKLWDTESGDQVRTFQAAGKAITSVRWLPGGPRVLGASADQNVRIWNADNGGIQANIAGAPDYIFCACASAKSNGRVAVGCADGGVLVWRTDNNQLVKKLDPPRTEPSQATAAK